MKGNSFSSMADRPLGHLDLEKAIALRWALRDIIANRLKLLPVKDEDLGPWLSWVLLKCTMGVPVVTQAGLQALD